MIFCLNNHVLVIHYELGTEYIITILVHYLQDSEQAIMGCTVIDIRMHIHIECIYICIYIQNTIISSLPF